MKTDLFQSCGPCWVFQVCWHIECSTLTASFKGMLSKSLIQFSVDGRGCVPFLWFGWGQTMVGLMTSFKRICARTVVFSVPDPAAGRCGRLLDPQRQVWLSLLWGHCSFLLAPGVYKVLFVPSKSLFPQFCGSSVIKSHWPTKSNSLGVLSPFAWFLGWQNLTLNSWFISGN